MWKDIPGYEGRYQASEEGQVRRVYKSGKTKLLTPYHKKNMRGSPRLVVKLTSGGRPKETVLIGAIARTFLGPCPDGCVPYHINGMQHDNSVRNIAYMARRELGTLTGAASRRRPVRKVDASGEPVAFYSSAREAGRLNHMSYQAVSDRCNGRVRNPLALDGCDYQWDDMDGRPRRPRRDRRTQL